MKSGFVLVPDAIAQRKDLSGNHKMVIGSLARIQGESAFCFPGVAYIANSVGLSERQVQRIINDLVKRNEIIRLKRIGQSSTYSVPFATGRNLRKAWARKRASS